MQEIVLDIDEVRAILPVRKNSVHKGSSGKVLVIAGSRGMTGAAILSSRAALRAGAGTVTCAMPSSLSDLVDVNNIEAMTFPLAETKTYSIAREAFPIIKELIKRFDCLIVGPGLSGNPQTIKLVADILQYVSREHPFKKVVLDADGLKALPLLVRPLKMRCIITPHIGELAMLTKRSSKEILLKPVNYARQVANKYHVVVVLKSFRTYIVEPRTTKYFLNYNGNPGMATAGSGDVLSGIIAGLWSSADITALKAAAAGPYVHAMAGNIAANKLSLDGIIASDILNEIPQALKIVKGK